MTMKILESGLKLSHVPRWSIVDMTKTQSVADHSFRVALIANYIADELTILKDRKSVLFITALFHDINEAKTGDIPSTCKVNDELVNSIEESVVKLADILEAIIFLERYAVNSKKVAVYLHNKLAKAKESLISYGVSEHYRRNVETITDKILEIGIRYD